MTPSSCNRPKTTKKVIQIALDLVIAVVWSPHLQAHILPSNSAAVVVMAWRPTASLTSPVYMLLTRPKALISVIYCLFIIIEYKSAGLEPRQTGDEVRFICVSQDHIKCLTSAIVSESEQLSMVLILVWVIHRLFLQDKFRSEYMRRCYVEEFSF